MPRAPELDRIDAACAGVTDGSVFWRKRAEELGLAEAVIPDLIRQVANRYAPNPPVWRHLLRWRRQHRLVLVNNGAAETFHHWLDKYGLERVFDLVINSAEFGLRKPERSFFLEVTRLLDIPPEKCVLIDDQTENIASAKSCGIKGAQTIPLNLWPLCQHQLPDSADMVQSSARRGAEDLSIHDGADAFMFRQFSRHSTILRTQHRHRYFMLSGGANLFPVAPVWKELLSLEVQSDLAYGWYTSQQGFPTLQHAVALWENYTAAQGAFLASAPLGRCVAMTLGASQAVAAIFDFVATTRRSPTVVLVGYNYPLFERQARRHRFRIIELLGEQFDGPATLPPADAVAALLAELRPALLVLVLPNNPAGEQYTEPEIAEILRAATAADTLVLLDQVGQMPMVQESWRNVGKVAADTATQAHMVLVNSFSKTDSIPGFRVGYMLGPEPVIQHTARFQLQDTMNPPTVPILPVFFTLLARCITVGERLGWARANDRTRLLRFARHLFAVTTAIAPPTLLAAVRRRLSPEQFDRDYQCYVDHQTTVARAIEQNHAYVLDRLRPYIERVTFLQGGFNFLIELAPFAGKDEDDVCSRLMAATGVALLTESCFRVGHRRRNNFWVRISLAAPTELFASAVDRLQGYLARF